MNQKLVQTLEWLCILCQLRGAGGENVKSWTWKLYVNGEFSLPCNWWSSQWRAFGRMVIWILVWITKKEIVVNQIQKEDIIWKNVGKRINNQKCILASYHRSRKMVLYSLSHVAGPLLCNSSSRRNAFSEHRALISIVSSTGRGKKRCLSQRTWRIY